MSLPSMCRLCLYSTNEYFKFAHDHDPNEILDKIQKFLYLQINDDDPFPRTICQKCMNRLQQFNEFYLEVLQNQEILQYSQPMVADNDGETHIFTITTDLGDDKGSPASVATMGTLASTSMSGLIPVASGLNLKAFGGGNYILTLQASNVGTTHPGSDTAPAIDLQQFITSVASPCTESTIPEIGLPKSIQSPSIAQNVSESCRSMSESVNGTNLPHAIKNEVSATTTTTTLTKQMDLRVSADGTDLHSIGPTDEESPSEVLQSNFKLQPHDDIAEMERELDSLESDVHESVDSDDEHNVNSHIGADETNDNELNDDIDIEDDRFNGFPKVIIKDGRLAIRGKQLVELMSKFYRLECDICEDGKRPKFAELGDLYHHYVSAHTMKGYVICCDSKLIQPRAMALHMARHLQPAAFKCPQCGKMLTCPKILQYHIQNHLPEAQRPLACSQCPRRFSYTSALIAHSITHQPEEERDAHVCDECGKTFASAGRLTTHVNVAHMLHGQNFICHICAKQFACRSNLSYHLTTHQPKVRKVQCEKCDKWLKNKLCLRKHMLQHSSIRYTCSSCSYSALNRQCLRNHIRVHHTDTKPFSCNVCGKSFKLKNTLLNHMVQHTGIRKFSCPFCTRTFASSGNYYTHRKRMHPQELAAMQLKQEEDERKLREDASFALH